jgi:hypothetical protein
VLGSETCHWKTDEHAASSDEEVVGAAEPSMAMCADEGLLLLGSSAHRKKGYMYRQFCRLHGNDEAESLCWFAPSPVMNPKLPEHVINRALAEDPHKARAEYLNFWREDLAEFLPKDVSRLSPIGACTSAHRSLASNTELLPTPLHPIGARLFSRAQEGALAP